MRIAVRNWPKRSGRLDRIQQMIDRADDLEDKCVLLLQEVGECFIDKRKDDLFGDAGGDTAAL